MKFQISMRWMVLMVFLGSVTGWLEAARPSAKFGNFTQLDIVKLEAGLRLKFDIDFPAGRFDIDYFFKGDLAKLKVDAGSALVTCPYVTEGEMNFSVGTGADAATWQPEFDVIVGFAPPDGLQRVGLVSSKALAAWPKSEQSPDRAKGEPAADFLRRSMEFWLKAAGRHPDPDRAKVLVRAAFRLVEVCEPQLKDLPNP